ncbi:MAG: hypothetical protein IT428_01685 [Planctomycetaceae bacterium]|nr:hypothetical protein [Planctomycetaceae bacterium]
MDAFPFKREEWQAVRDSALPVLNATSAEDDILYESHFIELQSVLHTLRGRYGDHPVLLETEADFTNDSQTRRTLYEQARDIAIDHRLPTASIRVALAGVLLDDFNAVDAARDELTACRQEIFETGDEWEQSNWKELMLRCNFGTTNDARE